ncbi:hypothetical protein [Actinoplanes xinjiangensis]|uniref:hypothetical protein n=1 Tax=Actinoplanes xinjiangensis TaxID=512350 RepID=UPI00341B034A
MSVERVSPEEEERLRELALAVAADLQFIGLEVNRAGDCWTGSVNFAEGFVVYYDPSSGDDNTPGVFARWKPSHKLLDAMRDGAEPSGHPPNLMYNSIYAMTEALRTILEAAGWRVEQGVYTPALKVSRNPV